MKSVVQTHCKPFSATLAEYVAVTWRYKQKAPTDEVEALVFIGVNTDAMTICNEEYTTEYL